ncbi:MAG: 3-oxoacyl-ACP reductase family protein [Segniliparus sp.]|uniref:3-oxoacyl-ACP reductase family protein n=1 Tax=Segniliparus sp. TaxID=2804064 RepID=UPI003F33CD1D
MSSDRKEKEFDGQAVLITGASRGIGRATALAFAERGADVAFTYKSSKAAADEVAERITALGVRALAYQGDIADPDVPEQVAAAAHAEFGRIDVLVNNAGITRDDLLVNFSDEDLELVLATNLLAPIRTTKAVATRMLRQRYGRIVNVSSVAASKPGKGQSNYAAAKGGLESFTKAVAVELAPRGIFANAVAPGVIKTDMTNQVIAAAEAEIKSRMLAKDYADPDVVADAVLYLASPRNTYITGEVLHIDGGWKMP